MTASTLKDNLAGLGFVTVTQESTGLRATIRTGKNAVGTAHKRVRERMMGTGAKVSKTAESVIVTFDENGA